MGKKREKILIGVAIVLVLLIMAFIFTNVMNDNNFETAKFETGEVLTSGKASEDWGLSFQEEGKPPLGNKEAQYLGQYDSYYIDEGAGIDGRTKDIYLTFDAGYENGNTAKILDILKEKNVPAAFFLVGNYLESEPKLVKRMAKEGHIVGNHTMHHPDMSEISDIKAFEDELIQLEKLYEEITGEKMKPFYRPPQGKFSEENLRQAKKLGYHTIFWSLAYVDWIEDEQADEIEAINLLNKRIHPGAVVLLHSTSKTNTKILGQLIDDWEKKGYKFKSIEELCKNASK